MDTVSVCQDTLAEKQRSAEAYLRPSPPIIISILLPISIILRPDQ